MRENTNTNYDCIPAPGPVDEYNNACVTLPLSKLLQIVEERVEAKTLNDQWSTKYWTLHAEKEAMKRKLEEMGRES